MDYSVNTTISSHGAARLILTNDIDLSKPWSNDQSNKVLQCISEMPVDEILYIIDGMSDRLFDGETVPQFSRIEILIEVPYSITKSGNRFLSYAQLGLSLKKDINASLDANTKFGENYGKGAAQVGIACFIDRRITLSSLSAAFCQIDDQYEQEKIVTKLYFRIPIVQEILKHAKKRRVNGYSFMRGMTKSTMERRGQSIRKILRTLTTLNNDDLNKRIANVDWDEI